MQFTFNSPNNLFPIKLSLKALILLIISVPSIGHFSYLSIHVSHMQCVHSKSKLFENIFLQKTHSYSLAIFLSSSKKFSDLRPKFSKLSLNYIPFISLIFLIIYY